VGNGATAEVAVEPLIRDELLPAATVRIDIGGLHAGSGFFAAPGLVVTCEHVLRPLNLATGASASDVRVIGTDERQYQGLDVADISEAYDLAVLRVEPAHSHACALLAAGLVGGDYLVTFGAPQRHPEGVPTELRAEGMTAGKPPMMKLSQGNVQPGMSGSPVLSLRTGGVCGVLKRTRDPTQALGGYAIPVETLFRLSRTLERLNGQFHERDPTWFGALPEGQRRLMRSGRSGAASLKPTRFLVVTVKQTPQGWEARAEEYPGGVQIPDVNVDLSAVRENVARVFRYWGRRGRGDPTDETRRLGSILAAVLPDRIEEKFHELIDDSTGPVQLVLSFDPGTDPDLVFLPWENLFVERPGVATDMFIAREDGLAFVRALEPELLESTAPVRRGLDVLLIDVDPARLQHVDADEEPPPSCVRTVCDALEEKGRETQRLNVNRLQSPGPTEIEDTLKAGDYQVVHYVGYGRFVSGEGSTDELALRGSGDAAYVGAAVFQAALAGAPPALVVMQLCDGPDDAMPADLSTFGPPLLANKGTGAVVAYQFPVPPRMSKQFNDVLYTGLLGGGSVGMAVQAARRRLWMDYPRSRAYLSPATMLRQPGEFPLTAKAAVSAGQSRVGALESYA
jgi:hypothetical protein